MVQLTHPCMSIGKTITLTIWTFVDKVMSVVFKTLSRFVIAFLPRSKCLKIELPYFLAISFLAAAKSLQSCPTLCDPIDGSPPGSPVPGSLQARTLEWVAIPFSNAWKWKVKVKTFSRIRPSATPWTAAFLHPWDFPGKSTRVGCHCLLHS